MFETEDYKGLFVTFCPPANSQKLRWGGRAGSRGRAQNAWTGGGGTFIGGKSSPQAQQLPLKAPQGQAGELPSHSRHPHPPRPALERGQPEGFSAGQARMRTSSAQCFGTPLPNNPITTPRAQEELKYNCTEKILDPYQHPGGNSWSSPQDPHVPRPGSQRIPLLMPQKTHCCLHLSFQAETGSP